jgi:hypothetical protein
MGAFQFAKLMCARVMRAGGLDLADRFLDAPVHSSPWPGSSRLALIPVNLARPLDELGPHPGAGELLGQSASQRGTVRPPGRWGFRTCGLDRRPATMHYYSPSNLVERYFG